jgi:hypothetical protein
MENSDDKASAPQASEPEDASNGEEDIFNSKDEDLDSDT